MEKILKIFLFSSLLFFSQIAICSISILKIPLHTVKVTLDPTGVQDISSLFVSRQVNCQLIRSYGSILTFEAAESVYFETPKKIIIRIKKSAVFQDGSAIKAQDVIASFDHLRKSRHVLRNIFNWVENIYAVNENEIAITLSKPVPQFLNVLSSPNYAIFKKSFLIDANKNPALWKNPMGCGNYKIAESSKKILKLLPIKEGLPIEFFLHQKNQLTAKEMNQYDISDLVIIDDPSNLSQFDKIQVFDPTQIYLGLNTQSKRWHKASDRCNFISMLDRQDVLNAYGNIAKPANNILPEGIIGYKPENFVKKTSNSLSLKINKKDKFCLSYLTVSIPEQYRPSFLKMIEEIFPSVSVTNENDSKHFGSDFVKTKCDAMILGLKSNTLDGYDILAVFSEVYPNFTGLFDKALSKKIEDSQNIINPATRAAIYQDLVKKIMDKCVVFPILTIPTKTIYLRKNLYAPSIGKGPFNEYYLGEIQ